MQDIWVSTGRIWKVCSSFSEPSRPLKLQLFEPVQAASIYKTTQDCIILFLCNLYQSFLCFLNEYRAEGQNLEHRPVRSSWSGLKHFNLHFVIVTFSISPLIISYFLLLHSLCLLLLCPSFLLVSQTSFGCGVQDQHLLFTSDYYYY